MLGSITANGNGSITAGTIDIDDPALGAALSTNYALDASPGDWSLQHHGGWPRHRKYLGLNQWNECRVRP